MDITKALLFLHPGARFAVSGETFTWLDDRWPAPTQVEIQSAWDQMEQAQAAEQAGAVAMASARSAMAEILDALPLEDRMKIQTLRVQVEDALDKGQVDLALYIVTNASVDAHLLPVRDQILALFPQA